MPKLNRESLKKLRTAQAGEFYAGKKVQIIVGMGTCGIAAGAKETFNAFLDEVNKKELKDVEVKQTGCMGTCSTEPTVEIVMPDMPDIIYSKVDEEAARRIVQKHIVNKKLVSDLVQDKPSTDILEHK
ncbi:MAG: (2Fe-2S) ferredoxin domain-containing protein [Candidatus Margulisiibacteriota bacterium]|jgi:NADP-reducing hydrogenase subunit HndB